MIISFLLLHGSILAQSGLVLNEVNSNQPGPDLSEYVELLWLNDGADRNGSLDRSLSDYSLVLFDGRAAESYLTLSLMGYRTNNTGYFLIGMPNVIPTPDIVVNGNFLRNGDQLDNPDAVALYRRPAEDFPDGTRATSGGLVDAVVYSKFGPRGNPLLEFLLTPRTGIIHESQDVVNGVRVDLTISRCPTLNVDVSYILSLPTPGIQNNCTSNRRNITTFPCPGFSSANPAMKINITQRSIVINEINADNPLVDTSEFLELFDGGQGHISLEGLTLVFFDGSLPHNRAYGAIDLSSFSTNAQGYFVVGSSSVSPTPDLIVCDHFLGNGPDAIALYSSGLSTNSTQDPVWSSASLPTSVGLLDAVVYSRGRTADRDLITALVPGQAQVQERHVEQPADEIEVSVSRCQSPLRLRQNAFVVSSPTAGSANNCSLASQGSSLANTLLISEVMLGNDGPYVELTDGGIGLTQLGDVYLVLGGDNRTQIDLSAFNTDRRGLFVIGSVENADYHVAISALNDDGGEGVLFLVQNGITLDSLLYSSAPDTLSVEVDGIFVPDGFSASRCFSLVAGDQSAFVSTVATPGTRNTCNRVMLNEVSIGSLAAVSLSSTKFIEVYDGGNGLTPLVQYSLVYEGDEHTSVISLSNFTTGASGYFTLSTEPVFGSHAVITEDDLFMFPLLGSLYLIRSPGNVNVSSFDVEELDANSIRSVSLSRCRNQSVDLLTIARPTPGLPNDCGRKVDYPTNTPVVINEIDANQPGRDAGEFIELYDGGQGNHSLDGLQVVIYSGLPQPSVQAAYSLLGRRTGPRGFYVIGVGSCACNPNHILNNIGSLPNRAGGIALYQIPPGWINIASPVYSVEAAAHLPPSEYLVDAIIYNARTRATRLPRALLTLLRSGGRNPLQENLFNSLSRCSSSQPLNLDAFTNAQVTPGAMNVCPILPPASSTTTLRPTQSSPSPSPAANGGSSTQMESPEQGRGMYYVTVKLVNV